MTLENLVSVEYDGSVVLLRPLTDAVREWLEEHVEPDVTWWGGPKSPALVVEPRFVESILSGLAHDLIEPETVQ